MACRFQRVTCRSSGGAGMDWLGCGAAFQGFLRRARPAFPGEVLVRWLVETKSIVYEMFCKTKKRVSLESGKIVLTIDESLTEDVAFA